jgi:radical SAM-linked protein
MPLSPSFFYQVLRPGRYLGGELDGVGATERDDARTVVWFYPERYGRAMTDPAWRRAYFQLRTYADVQPLRAIEFAADVWKRLDSDALPPFTLDGHQDLRQTGAIVFWIPDVFAAAHIPAILRRIGLAQRPVIGAVVDGWWAPRFLKDHVDWIVPAPSGWLPRSMPTLLAARNDPDTSGCCFEQNGDWPAAAGTGSVGPVTLTVHSPAQTPNWIPRVEVDGAALDVELYEVGETGVLRPRSIGAIVADAITGLRATGVEVLRFCDSGVARPQALASVLMEMSRLHNMKRVQIDLPPLTAPAFEAHWKSYKPHLLKPVLRLRVSADDDPAQLIEAGQRALNDGWHGLTAVLTFQDFDQFSRLLPIAAEAIRGWARAAATYTDKRPLRLQYAPAPVDLWTDPPSQPGEDDFRRLAAECRHFREDISSVAAVGLFRIEDVIARNWLAAADGDIWSRLEQLELADPNDESALPFDWCAWVRNHSGLNGPPQAAFSRRARAQAESLSAEAPESGSDEVVPPSVASAAAELFGRRKKKTGLTLRLSSPTRNRLRVQWGKSAGWRFYSHMDLVRAIERSIRKASLPAAYSEGFHPRMKLSFGPPLAFGLISVAEYFDLILDRGVESSDIDGLDESLPSGVHIVEAQGMPAQMPSLTETLNEAVYSAIIPLELEQAQAAMQRLLQEPRIHWTRPDRPDRRPFDPRTTLRATVLEATTDPPRRVRWQLTVSLGGEGNIRPFDWAALIFGFNPDQIASLIIERSAMLIRLGDRTKTPFDFP